MPETPHRRHQVRLRRAVAGSFLAAATAASLTGFTAAPAPAVPPAAISGMDVASAATVASPATTASGTTSQERLAGVRADLDRAVLLHLVTPGQADGFYAQIVRRVAAGL